MSDHSSGAEGNTELREFLRSRRARITPEEAGLSPQPGVRRVPGLRREEVAQLAGVSMDYYVRLERGRDINASEAVLDALARALCRCSGGRVGAGCSNQGGTADVLRP